MNPARKSGQEEASFCQALLSSFSIQLGLNWRKKTTNQRIVEFQSIKWMERDGKSCKKEEEKFNAKQKEN